MALVSEDELAIYCKLDEEDLIQEAVRLAETHERRLLRKGCVLNPATRDEFALTVKALTLHELDHPGEKIPQGIQDMINELKFAK